jgi:hypothetical protein
MSLSSATHLLRISDKIVANLGSVADWYIEEQFSYIRVFGCSVPPYALPLFLPDRLVCREVSRQTVLGGINKELKGVQKKVWPSFPLHIGTFSLLDFDHSKVEATTLEEMKLVDIEFKKHDPHKVMGNHMASCGLKRYEHEDSPHDEIFRGARSYSEVLSRVRALSPEGMIEFYKFQEHRRSGLPKVLQGKVSTPPGIQQTKAKGSTDTSPGKQETQGNTEETETSNQETEIPSQEERPPETDTPGKQVKDQTEIPSKGVGDTPLSTSNEPVTDATMKQTSTEIDSPIPSVTPLQSTKGNPDAGTIFKEDLTPISVEELPPSDFFFSKKRKVVVKRETHQRVGAAAKRYRVLTDGEALEEVEFTEEVAGTLGAYATTNQYSVGTLKEWLKQKDLLISKLQTQIAAVETNARNEAYKDLEQARAADQQEIEQLKSNLEQMHQSAQISQTQVNQQEELIKQLQSKLNSTESQVIDITVFQTQAMEIRKKIEAAQQGLLSKVEIIQNHFQMIDQALNNITLRERGAKAARGVFQEAIISSAKEEIVIASRLSIPEKTRGNILLKAWEHNIAENRKMAKEVRDSCEETFGLLNKKLLDLDKESSSGTLGKINIAKHLLDIKENVERDQVELSQIRQVDIAQIDKWLIKPNLQLSSIIIVDGKIGERLPQLEKKCYIFEANDQTEPSKLITQLVERCINCIEQGKGNTSGGQ